MRDQVDRLDAWEKKAEDSDADSSVSEEDEAESVGGHHFSLGASQRQQTIAQVEEAHTGDPAFRGFAQRLGRWLTDEYNANELPLPNGRPIKFTAHSTVSLFTLYVHSSNIHLD